MPTADRSRIRTGSALLLAGVVLVLWAWGTWVYRTSKLSQSLGLVPAERTAPPKWRAAPGFENPQSPSPLATTPPPTARRLRGLRLALWLMVIGLLAVFTLIAAIAAARAARRWKASLLRRPQGPTEVSDVWVMHKPPPLEPQEPNDREDSAGPG